MCLTPFYSCSPTAAFTAVLHHQNNDFLFWFFGRRPVNVDEHHVSLHIMHVQNLSCSQNMLFQKQQQDAQNLTNIGLDISKTWFKQLILATVFCCCYFSNASQVPSSKTESVSRNEMELVLLKRLLLFLITHVKP